MLRFVALIFITGCFTLCHAQTTLSQQVKDNIKLRVDNGIHPAIVVGVIDSCGTHYYSYGVKSFTTNEPVNERTVFEIGSISKTFTGILLADMVIKGGMSLDDPLQKYLPAGVTAPTRNGASVTLRHLSNHTSSLPRMPGNFAPANPANPFADYSEKQMYEFLQGYQLTRDIGSQYEYSNYAVGLLGFIMAKAQGKTYEQLMIDVIAKPLQLEDTRITFTRGMKNNLAMGHHDGMQVENWDITTLAGAGAIRSTAADMIKYLRANMGRQKSELYPAMQLSHKNSRAAGVTPIVGLGWHTTVTPGAEVIWHNGGTAGYRTFAGFTKGGERGVVVLCNSSASIDDIGMHLLNPKAPLLSVKPSIAVKIRSVIDAQGLDAAVKEYRDLRMDQGDQYDFSEGHLVRLGNDYLRKGETEKAMALFNLNAEARPESSSAFYGLGAAYAKQGNQLKAIEHYRKSVSLNPGNQSAIEALKVLGVDPNDVVKEIVVDAETLATYLGKYELAPGFILAVTRDGNQLKAQATGQGVFDVFPKSKNVFYLKVVDAQLTFNSNAEGAVESVTLHQGGRDLVGRRIRE